MTTQSDIREWLERGYSAGARYMLVVCDDFEHEDYPVFILPTENISIRAQEYHNVNMQRIMECYDLRMDWDMQLNTSRTFNGWPASSQEELRDGLELRETLLRQAKREL